MSENNPQESERPTGPPAFGEGRASTFRAGSSASPVPAAGDGSGFKPTVLYGAVLALAAASVYGFMQINQLKADLAQTREALATQIGQVNETSSVSTKSTRSSVDALKTEVDQARRAAAAMVGQAKIEAEKHADELSTKLDEATQQAAAQTAKVAESVAAVSTNLDTVKQDTNAKVTAVSNDVTAVKTQADATKAELTKTISRLTSTQGDLGVQSGLIATNSKELAALREQGTRNYTEVRLAKSKTTQKFGDLQIRLTKADPKKNQYTVEVMVDDKLVVKKDKTANEPVQFMLSRATQPYELVINEVKKDMIVGYVSAPKVQVARN